SEKFEVLRKDDFMSVNKASSAHEINHLSYYRSLSYRVSRKIWVRHFRHLGIHPPGLRSDAERHSPATVYVRKRHYPTQDFGQQ
ncbi:hypothetical protein COCMIDRAFT_109264, partial [Bipolaris oryzae ATCC 44560]